ncbi:MAG: hypothetical protein AAFQ89_05795 [Cyanobacteria bacterium J06626_18]
MLNQLIHIPSRYAGLTTDGCLIDGLAVVSGVFFQHYEQYFGSDDSPMPVDDCPPKTGIPTPAGSDLGWTKRWQRMQHWHFPHHLQLHQG